jgi:peptidoglycan/xylan/chitin deacetylase (PgdA/CDA1 family)
MPPLSEFAKEALQRYIMRKTFVWRLLNQPACALTFDDGPHKIYTPKILDLLARHQVKASFFLVGTSAIEAPELVRRIAREGHCIASHTYSHRDLPTLNRLELFRELTDCRDAIRDLTGVDTNLVRPPRGKLSVTSLFYLAKWGYRLIHWSKTYSDYLQDGSAELQQRIRKVGLQAGDIALFHDNNAHTVKALEVILPEWRANGHTFATVLERRANSSARRSHGKGAGGIQ